MDEGSGDCGSSGRIKSVSDAAKIANMTSRFLVDRLGIMGMVVGREREGLTILQVC